VTDTDPPGGSETLVRLRVAEIMLDETVSDRVTVPLKPLTLVRVIVEVAEEPCVIVRFPGTAEIVKSGGADWETLKSTMTECVRLPLVPVTVMFPELPADPPTMLRVAKPVPPGVSLTLEGVIDHTVHPGVGHRGEGVVCKLTVPLNPLRLVRVIVELPLPPDGTTTVVGLATIEKSGFDETIVNATFTL
jgi:hypothetical protein